MCTYNLFHFQQVKKVSVVELPEVNVMIKVWAYMYMYIICVYMYTYMPIDPLYEKLMSVYMYMYVLCKCCTLCMPAGQLTCSVRDCLILVDP